MTSARRTQQRIYSGNCDDSNSQLCSQLASTWGPKHRCLAVAAVDEGAESADCVEGVAGAILSEIIRPGVRTSEASSDLAPVIAGLIEDVETADGNEDRVTMPQESTKRTEALGMRLCSGRATLHAPGKRKAREPAVRSCLTTLAYPIVIIDDRRDEPERGRCYRVRFKDGSEDWLRRRGLEEDGNTQDCDFADAWYDKDKCRTKPFCRFLKGLPGYRSHQKAGEDADCVRLAVIAMYEQKGWAPLKTGRLFSGLKISAWTKNSLRPLGDSEPLYGTGGARQDTQPPGLLSTLVDWTDRHGRMLVPRSWGLSCCVHGGLESTGEEVQDIVQKVWGECKAAQDRERSHSAAPEVDDKKKIDRT
ncbi:hypothetical protein Plhal710r2_c025g0100691 [Plasmopara halstedii]